ncbi:MAG: VWA domain-containing protein, partial [Candidatus Woesearchaeota archaeon]
LHKAINAIESITIKIVGGTDISEAVITGTNLLIVLNDPRPKSIILMTDGQFNVGPELKEVIDYAKRNEVTIYAIGLGTPEGGRLKEGGFSRLDENTLKSLAFSTDGNYFIANDSEKIKAAYTDIIQPRILEVPHPVGGFLAILAILLLIVHWWLSNMRYGGIP